MSTANTAVEINLVCEHLRSYAVQMLDLYSVTTSKRHTHTASWSLKIFDVTENQRRLVRVVWLQKEEKTMTRGVNCGIFA
jgi:hypothetical protein